MSKQSAEDYLDKLLNSVNGEETEEPEFEEMGLEDVVYEPVEEIVEEIVEEATDFDDIFGDLTAQAEKEVKMASRRVSKSEADFLMEFEAELEGENFDDFLKTFDDEPMDIQIDPFAEDIPVGEDIPVDEEIPVMEEPVESESFEIPENLFGTDDTSEPEDIPEVEESATMEDLLQDMFADGSLTVVENSAESFEEMTAEIPLETSVEETSDTDSFSLGGVDLGSLFDDTDGETSAGDDTAPLDMGDDAFASLFGGSDGESGDSIDLGNMGEADLMSLLSGDGLGDIGDMLSQGDVTEVPMDGLDAFAAFAEGEMAAAAPEEAPKGKAKAKTSKGKPGGFLEKISTILFGLEEDEDETVSLGAKKAPSAGALSSENDAILASMDEEEAGKKKKEKKPKKEKTPKPKKEKKPKKPKAPKPKKEKKPVEVDNTPPLKKGPVFLICLMVASLFALVVLGTNLVGYASTVSKAKGFYDAGQYAYAYKELFGVEIKAKDMELYNQVATLATVDSELNAYYIFLENDRPVEAIDSLICAAGRCKINEADAEVYGCAGQMATLKKEVSNELAEKYGMTYDEAIALYEQKDRDDYTIALYAKMKELGIPVE